MDPAARAAILSIPEEHLKVAKPSEIDLYAKALELHCQLLSPLDLAMAISKAKPWPHVQLLNRYITAQMAGRLYYDGPGPAPVPDPSGATDEEGRPILVHPSRGDRPVFNFAISMPPRHGKSFLVSEHLPFWFLANWPEYSVLLASYEAQFAASWGAKVRDHIVDHPEYGIEVAGGRGAAKMMFDLEGHRGFMKCAGAGGPLTGSGGQLIIVDDPIKNAEQAMSQIERDNLMAWWHSTLYSRREPWEDGTPGRVILMSTRWHEDDPHGQLVPAEPGPGDRWCQLNLPAIWDSVAEESGIPCPLGRKLGDALCPERFPASELIEIRDSSGEGKLWFEALYQGRPSLDEGNIIKRPFNYYDLQDGTYTTTDSHGATSYVPEEDCYRFGTLDVAGTNTKKSDYTVLAVFDVTKEHPRRLFLRGIERVRITTEHHERLVLDWYERWNLQAIHVEDKTFGTAVIRRLIGKPGVVVQRLKADTNKVIRALPVQYEIINEMVWFPREAEWLSEFERELTKFPNTSHDDQVDALAYGVIVYKSLPPWVEKRKEPVTMEERVRDNLQRMAGKSKRHRPVLPGVGRW